MPVQYLEAGTLVPGTRYSLLALRRKKGMCRHAVTGTWYQVLLYGIPVGSTIQYYSTGSWEEDEEKNCVES